MQNGNAQNVTEFYFQKKINHWPKIPEICQEKCFFIWHFLEITSLIFSDYLQKDGEQCILRCNEARFKKKLSKTLSFAISRLNSQ